MARVYPVEKSTVWGLLGLSRIVCPLRASQSRLPSGAPAAFLGGDVGAAPAGRSTDRPPALEPRLGALQLRQGARRRPNAPRSRPRARSPGAPTTSSTHSNHQPDPRPVIDRPTHTDTNLDALPVAPGSTTLPLNGTSHPRHPNQRSSAAPASADIGQSHHDHPHPKHLPLRPPPRQRKRPPAPSYRGIPYRPWVRRTLDPMRAGCLAVMSRAEARSLADHVLETDLGLQSGACGVK